jgi:predicted phosphodiesterase
MALGFAGDPALRTHLAMSADEPGRSCPLHYRYRASDFAISASDHCDVLYVVGGLYGNGPALQRVIGLFERERGDKRLVFNGDFHWFDVDPDAFAQIQRGVFAFDATRGNVETELAAPALADGSDAGCGCAYPEWVGDGVVERSNHILARLRATAQAMPGACDALRALPMWRRIDVGDARVAVVHGDAQSLSGWGFAQETLRDVAAQRVAAQWFAQAQVDVFASSHTCLPVFQAFGDKLLLNNGAAGMPNFAGAHEGLLTRIATRPFDGPQRRFGVARGGLHFDAIAIDYDPAAWQRRFLAQWPPGSDAHASYASRIADGPDYQVADALRVNPSPTEA